MYVSFLVIYQPYIIYVYTYINTSNNIVFIPPEYDSGDNRKQLIRKTKNSDINSKNPFGLEILLKVEPYNQLDNTLLREVIDGVPHFNDKLTNRNNNNNNSSNNEMFESLFINLIDDEEDNNNNNNNNKSNTNTKTPPRRAFNLIKIEPINNNNNKNNKNTNIMNDLGLPKPQNESIEPQAEDVVNTTMSTTNESNIKPSVNETKNSQVIKGLNNSNNTDDEVEDFDVDDNNNNNNNNSNINNENTKPIKRIKSPNTIFKSTSSKDRYTAPNGLGNTSTNWFDKIEFDKVGISKQMQLLDRTFDAYTCS